MNCQTNETMQSIFGRYSCRDFAETPLTEAQIDALAKAAAAAPSAMNRQPWQIVMVTDKAFIEELDAEGLRILKAAQDPARYDRVVSRGGKLFYNAPCMVMVATDGSQYADIDCGILSQNVCLAAYSLGLGSVICAMAGIPLSGPRGDELKKRLRFPPGYRFGIAVLTGSANTVNPPHELDMEKVEII